MKLHRYVDHQRLHIVTKDVISLSISVLLLFRHYISHKITFGAPSSGGVLCSACGAFIRLYCFFFFFFLFFFLGGGWGGEVGLVLFSNIKQPFNRHELSDYDDRGFCERYMYM